MLWLLDEECIISAGEGKNYIALTLRTKVPSSLIQLMELMKAF